MAAQITAVIIFLIMFALIITEKIPRHIATTICSVATIILVFGVCMHSAAALWDTLNFQTFTSVDFWRAGAEATESTKGINWQTIIFIAGMMIMVEGMALSGFFSWLCLTIAKAVRYNTTKIFIMFMILAFVLSMFIDSITVILFLAAITITQSKLLSLIRFRLLSRKSSVRTLVVLPLCAAIRQISLSEQLCIIPLPIF